MSAFESIVWMVWLAFMLSPLVVLFGTVVAAILAATPQDHVPEARFGKITPQEPT
jgi:hypothetical protein